MENKLLVIGDLHITGNGVIDRPIIDLLRQIIKNYVIVFLGDVFDSFDISVKDNLFINFLAELKNNVIILTGNHDFSKNRFWGNIINPFKNNIKIIKDYEFLDINNYRLHFKNYFKHLNKEFEITDNKKLNILFSHYDLDVYNPPKEFNRFNLVLNGHIHNYTKNFQFINLSAVRKCKINESSDKYYCIIDLDKEDLDYKIYKFESVIDIKEVFVRELKDVVIEKNTILKILLGAHQDEKDIVKRIKALDWYDSEKVILKVDKFIDKNVISSILTNVDDNRLSLINIFNKYLEEYIKKFNAIDLNTTQIKDLFNTIYQKELYILKDLFNSYKVTFNCIECKNFKLFRELYIDFTKYTGITSIVGKNYDESSEFFVGSNESGKTCIRNSLEYAILGSSSDVKPLRRGEKSGYVRLRFNINSDDIVIERKFTKSGHDVNIDINNIPFNESETPTDKMSLFFEKYSIQNAIPFFLISDTGLARYFFSSKNSEKFKIFRTIFPIIENISQFINKIKEYVSDEELRYSEINIKYNDIEIKRKERAEYYWKEYFNYKTSEYNYLDQINQINNELESLIVDIELLNQKGNIQSILDLCVDTNIFKAYKVYENTKDIKIIYESYQIYLNTQSKYEVVVNKIKDLEYLILENSEINIKNIERTTKLKEELKEYNFDESVDLLEIKALLKYIKKYDPILEKYGWKISEEAKKVLEFNSVEIDIKSAEFTDLSNKLVTMKCEYDDLESQIKDLDVIICPNCSFEIKDSNSENILRQNMSKIKTDGVEIKKKKDRLFEELKSLRKVKENADNIKNDIQQFLESLSINNLYDYIDNIDYIKDKVKGYSFDTIDDLIEKVNNKAGILKEISMLEDEFENIRKNSLDYNVKLEELNKEKTKLMNDTFDLTKYNNVKKVLDSINLGFLSYLILEEKIVKILSLNIIDCITEDKFVELSEKYEKIEKMEKINVKKVELNTKLTYILKDYNIIIKNLKFLEDNISSENKKMNLKKISNERNEIKDRFDKLNLLYSIMTKKRTFNFEKYFIGSFFEKFNSIFNTFLQVLFTRSIELNVSESNFDFSDGNHKEIKFTEFSNGAKTKIQIALMSTINVLYENYGIASDILLLDEFIDGGLDENNINKVMEMLKMFFTEKQKLFIISHKDIEDFMDNILVIERKYNVSNIKI